MSPANAASVDREPVATESSAHVDRSGPEASPTGAQRLRCTIDGDALPYTVCEGPFTVRPGQSVYVKMQFSGRTKVDWCVEPKGGGGDFGCTGEIRPRNRTVKVWTNDTGGNLKAQLIAGRDGFGADILAEGFWSVRR